MYGPGTMAVDRRTASRAGASGRRIRCYATTTIAGRAGLCRARAIASLTINSGSSSLRFALYLMGDTEELEVRGYLDRIGVGEGRFRLSDATGQVVEDTPATWPDHQAAIQTLLDWRQGIEDLAAVGHRIVHGGPDYREPHLVTPELLAELRALIRLAPEHLPQEIAIMETIAEQFPSGPQVACFDTAFHRTMPEQAQVYALPEASRGKEVRRYGFHGLSCEYLLGELRKEAGDAVAEGRVIIAHLGNGASMTAVRAGRSVDTTMGLTPTGGLVMSTRAGDLDPSVVLYLVAVGGLTPREAHLLLNHQSGLLGLSGLTSDMKDLEARAPHDPRAALAVAVFCYQAKKFLAALAAALGGLEDLIFAGGIGRERARHSRPGV